MDGCFLACGCIVWLLLVDFYDCILLMYLLLLICFCYVAGVLGLWFSLVCDLRFAGFALVLLISIVNLVDFLCLICCWECSGVGGCDACCFWLGVIMMIGVLLLWVWLLACLLRDFCLFGC